MVDSLLSTSSAFQMYHHLTSCSVEIPQLITAEYSTSVREEPVSSVGTGIIDATICSANLAVQSIIIFINVLQCHTTVILISYTIE